MPYIPLHHKYRPQTFADLIGQDAMVRTLKNAFAADRIAHACADRRFRVDGDDQRGRGLRAGHRGGPDLDPAQRSQRGAHHRFAGARGRAVRLDAGDVRRRRAGLDPQSHDHRSSPSVPAVNA